MPNWSGTVLTAKGLALQAKVEAGATMEITKLKIGDGVLGGGGSVAALNDLVSPKKVVDISALTPLSGGTCKIHGVVTNDGVETGFYVRELGVFAADPDLGEILYAYAADGAPDYLPAEGGAVAVSEELVINLAFSTAATITANIALDGLVTVNILNAHNTDPDAHGNLPALRLWQPNTTYAVGDVRYPITDSTGQKRLECVVAGNSGPNEPEWTSVGTLVTDGTVTWIVDDVRDGTPVGRAVPEILTAARAGYLQANGALVARASYPRLWAWANATGLVATEAAWSGGQTGRFAEGDGATTFRLPDLRAEFIRGLDDGRGIDADRVMGAAQGDDNKEHIHDYYVGHTQASYAHLNTSDQFAYADNYGGRMLASTLGANHSVSSGGTESRPRNIAYLYCIKY